MPSDTTNSPPRLIDDVRGVRYGEVIAVFERAGCFEAEVFGTQFLNECPQELWDSLRSDDLAAELGALFVKLNGPRHWVIDGIGQKVNTLEPVVREFNGLAMRRLAVIDLADGPTTSPYTQNHVHRGVVFFYDAEKPVYELVASRGGHLCHAGLQPGRGRGHERSSARSLWASASCRPPAGASGYERWSRSWSSIPRTPWPSCSRTNSSIRTRCRRGQAHRAPPTGFEPVLPP